MTITIPSELTDATLDVRAARGPSPASCDEGRSLESAEGTYQVHAAESVTACLRDRDGNVRASATSRGPRNSILWDGRFVDGAARAVLPVQPFDDDVTAIVFVTTERELPAIGCRIAPYEGNDDWPEYCEYDCGGARILGEIPRAVVDETAASLARAPASADSEAELSIAISVPISFPSRREEEPSFACVRTSNGGFVTSERVGTFTFGDAPSCAFDVPSGCITSFGSSSLRTGDVLIGRTNVGAIVRAPIRRATTRSASMRIIDTEDGGSLWVAADALVRTSDGDVRADSIVVGTVLFRRNGPTAVREIREDNWQSKYTLIDLEGATYVLQNGFAIRDAGGVEPEAASLPDPRSFVIHESFAQDCGLDVEWSATRTSHDVMLSARPIRGPRIYAPHAPSCTAPRLIVPARAISAIASLGESARIIAVLSGHGIECDSPYAVTPCVDGQPVEPEALTGISTPACLPAGTAIAIPGGTVPIERLIPGQVIESFDVRRQHATRAMVIGLDVHRDRALSQITLSDGHTIEATGEHLVLTGSHRTATRVSELSRGDRLWVSTGDGLIARRITNIAASRSADVYELRVTLRTPISPTEFSYTTIDPSTTAFASSSYPSCADSRDLLTEHHGSCECELTASQSDVRSLALSSVGKIPSIEAAELLIAHESSRRARVLMVNKSRGTIRQCIPSSAGNHRSS